MAKLYNDLRDILTKIDNEYKDEIGFKQKVAGQIVCYKYPKYVKDIRSLGEYLLNQNISNQRIAFISPNRYEWEVTYMAVACSNLICVPLDRSLPEEEFKSLLIRSESEMLIYDEKYDEFVEKFKQDPEIKVKRYICMDREFEQILEEGEKLYVNPNNKFDKVKIDREAMKFMLFTSGTTATSKCVMISHKNLCANIDGIAKLYDLNKNDTFLSFLPLHHTFECTTGFLYATSIGAKIAYCEGLRHFVNNIKDFDATCFICVPAILEVVYKNIMKNVEKNNKSMQLSIAFKASNALMKLGIDKRSEIFKDIHEKLGKSLRKVVCGGAALNPEVSKALNELGINVFQGYGLTETSPVVCAESDANHRYGSIGLPMDGVEVKIVNPDADGIGELITRSDSVMIGYYDNEEATKEVMKDGWFYTGDLAKMDKDGYVYITGRKKDVIVLKNGKNVFPDELEYLISKLPAVSECIVYGRTVEDGDVNLHCKIVYNKKEVAEDIGDKTEQELYDFYWDKIKNQVNKKMPTYKYIKNVIVTSEPLIKTTTNKVKRPLEIAACIKQEEQIGVSK